MRAITYFKITTICQAENHSDIEIMKIFDEIKEQTCSRHLLNVEVDPPKISRCKRNEFNDLIHLSWICKIDWLDIDDFIKYWNIVEKEILKDRICPRFTMRIGEFLV